MLRTVEGRADQVGHGRIHDHELPVAALLYILYARQQDAGVACNLPARLDYHVQAPAGQQRDDRPGIVHRQRAGALFVVGCVAPADIQNRDLKALAAELVDQGQRLRDGGYVRLRRVDRRADVDMDRVKPHVFILPEGVKEPLGPLDVHAKLSLPFSRGGVGMGFGIVHVGVQSQRGPDALGGAGGQLREILELRLGLYVEHSDAGVDGLGDFPVGLADAGEDDLAHVGAGGANAGQLPAGDHVKAAARPGKQLQDMNVRQRLYRKADGGLKLRERIGQGAVVVQQRGRRVEVQGRAGPGGGVGHRHLFAKQQPVAIFKMVHLPPVVFPPPV